MKLSSVNIAVLNWNNKTGFHQKMSKIWGFGVMEVVPGVHLVEGVNANCYFIVQDKITLIDAGLPGNASKILKYLEQDLGASSKDLEKIVITHHHFDHTGSLSQLKELTNAQVLVHKADADYVSGNKIPPAPFFMKFVTGIYTRISKSKPVQVDVMLKDKDNIGDYRVIHIPGHTPGSICLFNPKNKVLFVGDSMRYRKDRVEGPVARFSSNPEQVRESLLKLRELDVKVMLSGHSPPLTEDTSEKLSEFFGTL
jgi:hydroxyacylglutathione hydrolase